MWKISIHFQLVSRRNRDAMHVRRNILIIERKRVQKWFAMWPTFWLQLSLPLKIAAMGMDYEKILADT